jgi:tRNA pseudouridine38-40 synthase
VLRNIRLRLAYDGSRFFGWQRQSGFASVQEAVEDALEALCGERVCVHGAGRTDTGVHALGQVAHFHADTRLDDHRLLHALNAHLPDGVVAERLETCAADFHAQRDALGKRYFYAIRNSAFPPPFGRDFCHWVRQPLDRAAMRSAAAALRGRHDFSAFANAGSPRHTNVRRIASIRFLERGTMLALFVQGDGFLYNMMRTIAGTLLEVGRGKLEAGAMQAILASRDRERAGPTAPPGGLYLLSVLYADGCLRGRHVHPFPPPSGGIAASKDGFD